MKIVYQYLKAFFGRMGLGLVIKIAGTVVELFLPLILSHILGNVIGKEIGNIVFWGCMMIVCSALAWIFNVIANRMAADVSRKFITNLRKDLFLKTLHLSAAQTDKFTIPSLESRITTDTYNVLNFVNRMQRLGVRAPILLLGGISITLFMDAYLSLVMIAILPFIFITVYFISRNGVPLYTKVQRSVDGMVRVVREDAQGIRVIKALSKVDYEHRRYDYVNKTLSQDETHAGTVMGTVNPIMTVFMNLGSVGVIALGAFRVSKGLSNPETVIAFIQYFTLISNAMLSVTRMFIMYTKCAASAGRIEEVFLAEEQIRIEDKYDFPDKKTEAHILFDDVTFSYKGRKNNVEHIQFSLKKGGSLGIIGATGSGKSTIIKLLLRFYDTNKGGIYINGENIRTIDKERFYKMFGSALQYDFLFADTIEENIKFGRGLSHDEVAEAAKTAQAYDFITSFEEGFEHKLTSHGTNISGGQKQRILIARAIAAKPEILILDDSSSALDYKTDAALRSALDEAMSDTTIITVAQRVSSVKNSDLILVLEEGKIIGAGTHEELLSQCQEYKEISDSQMGGAFVE